MTIGISVFAGQLERVACASLALGWESRNSSHTNRKTQAHLRKQPTASASAEAVYNLLVLHGSLMRASASLAFRNTRVPLVICSASPRRGMAPFEEIAVGGQDSSNTCFSCIYANANVQFYI